MDYTQLTAQARQATEELLEAAHLETGDIFVVGCSSSEIMGGHIGHDSSMEAAAAVLAGVQPPLQEQGVYLAAQCCEHLNRSIVLEREAAKAYGCQIVAAIPQPHAGGSGGRNPRYRRADGEELAWVALADCADGGSGQASSADHQNQQK